MGIGNRQCLNFIAVGRADEALVVPVVGTFARTLNELDKRTSMSMVYFVVCFRGCKARPAARELVFGNCFPAPAVARLVGNRDKQVEAVRF
jgi:hypothetical protein